MLKRFLQWLLAWRRPRTKQEAQPVKATPRSALPPGAMPLPGHEDEDRGDGELKAYFEIGEDG